MSACLLKVLSRRQQLCLGRAIKMLGEEHTVHVLLWFLYSQTTISRHIMTSLFGKYQTTFLENTNSACAKLMFSSALSFSRLLNIMCFIVHDSFTCSSDLSQLITQHSFDTLKIPTRLLIYSMSLTLITEFGPSTAQSETITSTSVLNQPMLKSTSPVGAYRKQQNLSRYLTTSQNKNTNLASLKYNNC